MNKIILTFSFFIAFLLSASYASTFNNEITLDEQKLEQKIKKTNKILLTSENIINKNAKKILKMRKFIRKYEIAKNMIKTTFIIASFMAFCFTLFYIWNYNMPENTSSTILASTNNHTNAIDIGSLNKTNIEKVDTYALGFKAIAPFMCNDCSPKNEYYPNLPDFYQCDRCPNRNSIFPSYGCTRGFYGCLPKGFLQWITLGFFNNAKGINTMIYYINTYSQKLQEITIRLNEINEFTNSIYNISQNSFQKIFTDIQNINATMQNRFQTIEKTINTKINETKNNTAKKNLFNSIYITDKQICESWLTYISTVYKDCIKNVQKKGYLQEITLLSFNCYLLIANNMLLANCFLS